MEMLEQNLLIFIIIGLVVFLGCVVTIFFIVKHQKILDLLYKINEADKNIKININNEFEFIIRAIGIIERELKIESKILEDVKNINKSNINNFDLDNLLTDAYNKILEIKDDNEKIIKVKSFSSIIEDLEAINIDMIALRTFYNKYTSRYNNLINRFPYKMISKFKNYKNKGIYSGKEIEKSEF